MKVHVSPYDLAKRYIGVVQELPGGQQHPLIQWWLSLCGSGPLDQADEVAWCSAFTYAQTWALSLPGARSLRARRWLTVGKPIAIEEARADGDVIILKRGSGYQPGPEVIEATGHVGFFAGLAGEMVRVLGGNQSDSVSIQGFPIDRVLGVRRLSL